MVDEDMPLLSCGLPEVCISTYFFTAASNNSTGQPVTREVGVFLEIIGNIYTVIIVETISSQCTAQLAASCSDFSMVRLMKDSYTEVDIDRRK